MDTSQYKDLFISEGKEILNSLNTCLVSLEKKPDDVECLNEIFRQAHTLKGMAASMGYEEITELTHEMESALDLLRRGRVKADKETVDLLFKSFDCLEALVDDVAAKDAKKSKERVEKGRIDISALTGRLQKIVAYPAKKESVREEKRSNLRLEDADRLEIVKAAKEGEAAYRLTVSLRKECPLKEARALTVVKLLEEMGRVIRSEFIYKQFEGGKFGRHFGLFFITKEPTDSVKERVQTIQDVDKIVMKPLEVDEVVLSQRSEVRGQKTEKTGKETPRQETQMIRVALNKLDNLMNLVGELVINKVRLSNIGQSLEHKELNEALTQMGRLTDEMQMGVMEVRLVPMDYIFNRFPRMVRDLAAEEKKEIDLIIEGADIGLDRTILDEINDPIIHLLRNAVNHGIEMPEARKKLGKEKTGSIKLTAKRERNYVIIEISDDGAGIDPEEIKKVAAHKGIISGKESEALSDEETLMLITSPGFSTSKVVTQTSGRGVGMNLVRQKVESFGGTLSIESRINAGSKFAMKLPLSMAIIQALLVRVESETYAIPLVNITETIKIKKEIIKMVEHHEVCPYRDMVLPLIRLNEKFGFPPQEPPAGRGQDDSVPVVVVEVGHRKAGLVVNKFLGQQEVVIKTIKGAIKNMPGIAGATILGDGKVAMIVDVSSIV